MIALVRIALSRPYTFVVLALLPMIVVAIAGSVLVGERMNEAHASRAAEHAMTEVADLDNLRNLLASELSSTALQDAAVAFKLTRHQVDAAFGVKLAAPLAVSRRETDVQLAYLARSMPSLTGLAALRANLLRARSRVDLSFATPKAALAASSQTAVDFTNVLESASALEQSITNQLVRGQSGSVPHDVVVAAAQLRAVSDLTIAGAREGDLLYLIIVAPDSQFRGLIQQLDTVRGAYESAAAQLAPNLSPALRAEYERIARAGGKLRGILWYQGCSDASADWAPSYLDRMTAWVAAARADTGVPDLPVLVVQIGNLVQPDQSNAKWWDMVREALRRDRADLRRAEVAGP